MVCSSTLRAKPVTHSTKRCWPRWVKPTAIGNRMACQSDHSGVTFIAHLLEGWFVGGHNRQAPSRRCACQSTRMQDNGERHCQTLDFTRNYCLAERLAFQGLAVGLQDVEVMDGRLPRVGVRPDVRLVGRGLQH